jgi:ABC-type sugar transport system substrate-binding protein
MAQPGRGLTIATTAALLMVASVSISAVGADEDFDPSGKRVAIVLYGHDPNSQAQGESFRVAAEAEGAIVNVIDGKGDMAFQVETIDDLIAAGETDGLVFNPADPTASAEISKRVQDAGIPMIFIESPPPPEFGVTAPWGKFNDYELTLQAGRDAATYVTEEMGQTPKVVIFDLLGFETCHEIRMQGFVDGLMEVAPDTEIVFWDDVPYDVNLSLNKMEDLLQANPDFNIFTGCGGDMIVGGIKGLEAAGRAKADNKVPQTEYILTIDGTPAELERLIDPNSAVMQTITMTPKTNGQAYWDLLREVMSGEVGPTEPKVVDLPGLLMPTECTDIAAIYEDQYGASDVYVPIDCSTVGG